MGLQYQDRTSALETKDETNVLLSCKNSPGRKKPSLDRILSADSKSTFDNFAPKAGWPTLSIKGSSQEFPLNYFSFWREPFFYEASKFKRKQTDGEQKSGSFFDKPKSPPVRYLKLSSSPSTIPNTVPSCVPTIFQYFYRNALQYFYRLKDGCS